MPSPSAATATTFRHPFLFDLPAGSEFDFGTMNETYWEVRVPAAAAAGRPAGIIIQDIGGGRIDPCAASSAPLPLGPGTQGVIDYLNTVPGLDVSDEGSATVGLLPASEARVKAGAETSTCPDIWPWVEDTEAFTAIPRGEAVRMLAVVVADDNLVLTVFGEDGNPGWKAIADQLISSIRFPPGLQPRLGVMALQPWPGAMRIEPSGRATIVNEGTSARTWSDPAGDGAPTSVDIVDIVGLQFDSPCYNGAICVYFDVAGQAPRPLLDPASDWVAYGLVVDNDGDGVGDVQAGIDNVRGGPRAWKTDLHTDETVANQGTWLGDISVDGNVQWLVDAVAGPMRGWVGVGPSVADPLLHFYVWAAVIRDGEVVSIDFAPNEGWLDGFQPLT